MDAGRRLSPLAREKILYYHHKGLSGPKIIEQLRECNQIITTRQTVTRFLIRNKSKHANTETRKQKLKVTDSHGKFIDFWIATNPNINSRELKEKFQETFGVVVSDSLMRKVRRKLGWQTRTNIQYCQLITNVNKKKRLEYSLTALENREDFKNVIFVDESSVEMSSSGRMYFYKNGSCFDRLPTKAPKPKHAYKVHVWAGISYQGRTDLCIFSGVMDSVIYQGILQDNLLPFVNMRFPDGYRLYQDNDRKHTSKSTQEWMTENNMLQNVMTVPPSSPDLNPIENVWAAMKDHLQRNVKPKKKEELITGIRTFWESLTPQHCARYIDHVHKVIPHVVLNMGGPTQF